VRRLAVACALVCAAAAAAAAEPPAAAEQFDCVDAFDLVATGVILGCALWSAPPAARTRLDAARERLLATGLASPEEFAGLVLAFCPLPRGTGMVPAPDRLYLDDGLMKMSVDGLAEILAHELEHRRQFLVRGVRGFKCDYVRAMRDCGGCQDRRHALERAAYERQDRARARLLASPGDPEA
jgi:hypothetical protein